ncbi:MAG: hypothetical protein HYV42_05770 [Candidatus Magasanikbacteria bacterium]|nr:hypothetical protein [Candidatus Magasanikbacteria bacterium]
MRKDTKILPALGCLVVFFGLFSATATNAARFYWEAPAEVAAGQATPVTLFLDTENESINALAGTITFTPAALSVTEASDGNSLVNFWLERPLPNATGTVRFAGITPGGFPGSAARILTLVVVPQAPGKTTLTITKPQVLRHDGAGTATSVTVAPLTLTAVATTTAPALPPVDTEPPEPFTPIVTRDPNLLDNRWVLIFSTPDKGSGLARYEAVESRRRLDDSDLATAPWAEVASPYLLRDQSLTSFIYVRAVDHQGNLRLSLVAPLVRPWYTKWPFWGILGIPAVLLGSIWLFLWKRRKIIRT